jgi:hypothetical protein
VDFFLNTLLCVTAIVLALVFVSFYVVVVKGHPFFSEKTIVNAARLARALTGIVFAPLASWWAVYFLAYFVLFISENF